MAYNKKDEDENTVVKVDRTSVFQEGMPRPRRSTFVIPQSALRGHIMLTANHQPVSSTHLPYRLENAASS